MTDKFLLFPYWLTLKIRHCLYDSGLKKVHEAEVPTVCIGNLAVGGTGKTPHTEMVLRMLLSSNEWGMRNIAVLSRGYKRKSRGFQQVVSDSRASFTGDEPLQIKKKFPVVTVAVDKDRIEGCDFLCHPEKLAESRKARKCVDKAFPAADLIVLDDAFQYRALKASANVVLIDYNRPLSKDALMPLGRLRDLPSRIKAADIIVVTKCPAYIEDWQRIDWVKCLGINDFDASECAGTLRGGRRVTVVFTTLHYQPLQPVFPESGDPRYIYSKKLVLFTGIAKDTPLRQFLSDKYKIVRRFSFPDHHKFSRSDIRSIQAASAANSTAVVVTTEKDAQRVLDCDFMPSELKERMFLIPVQAAFLSELEKAVFTSRLLNLVSSKI